VKVTVATKILEANDRIALENRRLFNKAGLFVINLMSGPGAGKTSLLEKTLLSASDLKIGVIEGDIAGSDDAVRIEKLRVPVIQINTAGACHLDANMIYEVLPDLPLDEIDLLFIENVGNLVCPAEFTVGEDLKVMLLSIAEGHDKPLKYPLMFQKSAALLVNKMDLAPYLDVDIDKIRKDSLSLNPGLKIFEVSCKTGEGISEWTEWLRNQLRQR
jgi:hydrogenase nickel incorporation protein HypB